MPSSGGRLVLLAKRRGDLPVYALAFSPANAKERLLAAGGVSQTVSLWDVENPAEPRTILLPVAQTQSILSLAFSADGETLAAGDGRGSVCLYDVRSLRPIGSRRCLTGSASWAIDALVFDPSGRALLSSGRGQPVVAWNRLLWGAGTPSQVRDAVCRLARRNLTSAQWAYAFDGTKMARHWHATCRT